MGRSSQISGKVTQVAALPWRHGEAGVEVMLITSRETRRWVLPKGGRMSGLTDYQAAAQEAFEEAGIKGDVGQDIVGQYLYDKRLKSGASAPYRVDVYPLEVFIQLGDWPEAHQRKREWMSAEEAASRVHEPELASILRAFKPAI